MKLNFICPLTAIVFILVLGCRPPEANETFKEKLRSVKVSAVASRNLPVVVQAVGSLAPNREVAVSAQVAGTIMAYNARVGDKVGAGQWLVKLDATDYILGRNQAEAALKAVQARMAMAQSSYDRAKSLLPDRAITPEMFDRTEAEYKSAQASEAQLKAALDITNRQIEKTVIEAPFSGYVTQRLVEIGQSIHPGEVVMALADMENMRVRVFLNEQDYVLLDANDPVTVTVEAFADRSFKGVVDTIGIKADPRTNTFLVEILVPNPQNALKAGLTARVALQVEVIEDAILIPQNTVLFREDRREVFVVESEGQAVARQVLLGRTDGALIRILDGLAPGDRLVTSGGQYLKTGDKVIVVP